MKRTMLSKYIVFKKTTEYYDGLLIRTDPGLHEQIANFVCKNFAKGSNILDMGCGQGALSARLHDIGYKVTAADVNVSDFKSNRDIDFCCVNFNDEKQLNEFIDNKSETYDVVLGIEVIEHIENPWAYLRALKEMTKKGGMVIVSTPNITSWLSRLSFLGVGEFMEFKKYTLVYGHINPISAYELNVIMTKIGFSDIEIHPGGRLPPLYFTSIKTAIFSLIALVLRPFQRGILDGWCIYAAARRK